MLRQIRSIILAVILFIPGFATAQPQSAGSPPADDFLADAKRRAAANGGGAPSKDWVYEVAQRMELPDPAFWRRMGPIWIGEPTGKAAGDESMEMPIIGPAIQALDLWNVYRAYQRTGGKARSLNDFLATSDPAVQEFILTAHYQRVRGTTVEYRVWQAVVDLIPFLLELVLR